MFSPVASIVASKPPTHQTIGAQQIVEKLYEIQKQLTLEKVPPEAIYERLFDCISENIGVLDAKDDCDSSRMPVKFQEALVLLIMSKNSGDSICQHHIMTALDELTFAKKVKSREIDGIKFYAEPEIIEHLLDSGAALYRYNTEKKIN